MSRSASISAGVATEGTRHGNNRADACAERGCARVGGGGAFRSHQQYRQAGQKRRLRSCAAIVEARAQQITRTKEAAEEASPPLPTSFGPWRVVPREAQPWVIHLAAGAAQRASGYPAGQSFLEALIEYFRRLQWTPAQDGVAEG